MLTAEINGFKSCEEICGNHSPSTLRIKQTAEREKIVKEAMNATCIPLACECLRNYVYEIHNPDSPEQLMKVLDRIEKIYNQNFQPTPDLNTSLVRRPTFLTNGEEIQQAFIKADKLFVAYRDLCINEAIPTMPEYFIQKLNLMSEDLEIVTNIFKPAVNFIKEQFLDGEFSTFQNTSTHSFIHYFLRIPPRTLHSDTSWALRDLKNVNLIND